MKIKEIHREIQDINPKRNVDMYLEANYLRKKGQKDFLAKRKSISRKNKNIQKALDKHK